MEQQITGREIMLFMVMFDLWDAWVATDVRVPDGGIEFRSGSKYYGYDEINYVLHSNGKYDVEVRIDPGEVVDGDWKPIMSGNIFEEGQL